MARSRGLGDVYKRQGYAFQEPFSSHNYEGDYERPSEDELRTLYQTYENRLKQFSEEDFIEFVDEDYLFNRHKSKIEIDDVLEDLNQFLNNYFEELE
jgi:hypothetical protein